MCQNGAFAELFAARMRQIGAMAELFAAMAELFAAMAEQFAAMVEQFAAMARVVPSAHDALREIPAFRLSGCREFRTFGGH